MTWTKTEARTANTGLAKVAVQCFADTFVVNQTLVLRINICGENRHLRQTSQLKTTSLSKLTIEKINSNISRTEK
jgi:hypothetical protein